MSLVSDKIPASLFFRFLAHLPSAMSSEQQKSKLSALNGILTDYRHLDISEHVEYDNPKKAIACGAFGEVYKGRYTRPEGTKIDVAIKCSKVYEDGARDEVN